MVGDQCYVVYIVNIKLWCSVASSALVLRGLVSSLLFSLSSKVEDLESVPFLSFIFHPLCWWS